MTRILACTAIFALLACDAPAPSAGAHANEALDGQPPIISESRRDTLLELERQVGINGCFLTSDRVAELERLGWRLVRCDEEYAVAAAEDRIGLAEGERIERQQSMLMIFPTSLVPQMVEKMRIRAREQITGELKTKIAKRFGVSTSRERIFVTGFVDEKAHVYGSVSIALDEYNLCDFGFPDSPFPQTECHRLIGNVLLKVRTNSQNFEAIEKVLSSVATLGWGK